MIELRIFIHKMIILFLATLQLHNISYGQPSANTEFAGDYEITLNQQTPFLLSVKARFKLTDDSVYIHPGCPSYKYTDGWASFVKHLKQPGEGLPKFIGNARWALANRSEGENEINIAYDVDLNFVNEKWDAGNEQAGIFVDSSMFVVSRALFIHGNAKGKYRIKVNLPVGWRIVTPWQRINKISYTYVAASLEKLINNTMVWGKPFIKTIQSGSFILNVALLGEVQKQSKLLLDVFEKSLHTYQNIFRYYEPVNYDLLPQNRTR